MIRKDEDPWNPINRSPKFVLAVLYNKEGIYMSIRSKEPMKEMLQIPCGKVESGKSSWEAVIREIKEETGLEIWPSYLLNDKFYDCDIYTYRLGDMEKPERTELEKNSPWYLYLFDQYEEKAEKGQTTPSHTKFTATILGEIEEKLDKEYKRKRDNQSPSAKREHYTEVCRRCDE